MNSLLLVLGLSLAIFGFLFAYSLAKIAGEADQRGGYK